MLGWVTLLGCQFYFVRLELRRCVIPIAFSLSESGYLKVGFSSFLCGWVGVGVCGFLAVLCVVVISYRP